MRTELSSGQIRELVIMIFEEITGSLPPRGLDSTPDDLADWTSLTHIRLLHAIEQQLGCQLDERLLAAGPALGELADAACAAAGAPDRT